MATQTIERPAERPSVDLEARFRGRCLSVTSFQRDGTGVATRRRCGACAATRARRARRC